ncbi:MAG: hypothetical protein KC983_03780 [Phycisphaerales bacterium]|nr:hypothetical protein [Phycisphaerales bacterium]
MMHVHRTSRNRCHETGALTLLAVLCSLVFVTPAWSAALTETQRSAVLAEADEAYTAAIAKKREQPAAADALFRTAASKYQVLVDDGVVNGKLYYNLGNAQMQSGRIGAAIHSYRIAQELIPGDARLEQNLSFARSQRRTKLAPTGTQALTDALLGWHGHLSWRAKFIAFGIVWCGLWLTVYAMLRTSGGRLLAGALAVAAVALGVSLVVDLIGQREAGEIVGRDAVIVRGGVTLRKGDGEGFDPAYEEPLDDGVECTILEVRPNWMHVELTNDAEGWVPAEVIRPVIVPEPRPAT